MTMENGASKLLLKENKGATPEELKLEDPSPKKGADSQ